MSDEYLEKLRDLTPRLSAFADQHNGVTEYRLECGNSIGFGLYSTGEVAVQRALLTYGTIFSKHTHREVEFLIPYTGVLKVVIEDQPELVINPGDVCRIPPNTPHHVEAMADTWVIGITVSAAEGYPDV